jgi:DNA repair exonuclease SbcCD ATPase subunit
MLRELRATDFGLFRKLRLPLRKQGLVWISGDNRDTASAVSNGSGKTTLSKALTWCLYGESIDGEDGDEVIHEGCTRAIVEVELDGGWTVRRERTKGSPKLSLIKDGKAAKEGKADIQARIIELVGLDFKAFRNTALYGQNDTARFADRRVNDKERKDALQRLLRAEVLKVCGGIARARAAAKKRELDVLTTELERLRARFSELDLEGLRAKMDQWEADREEISDRLRAEARAFKAEAEATLTDASAASETAAKAEALKADLAAAEKAQERAQAWEDGLAVLDAELHTLTEKLAEARAEYRQATTQLARLQGETCPVCTSPLKEGHAKKHRGELNKEQDRADREVKGLIVASARVQEKRDTVEASMDTERKAARRAAHIRAELEALQAEADSAGEARAKASRLIERARDKIQAVRDKAAEVNPHIAYVEEARARRTELKGKIKLKQAERAAKGEEAAVSEFWVRGYSGQGFPSFLLDGVMPYITERANHYLDTLSDGDITIQFATQRELKSAKGEYRDEIDIRWVIEDVADKAPSGGQQRKIEIATDLALMDLAETREGGNLSFFWADEVFDGLDAEGTNRVLTLLHELRARKGTVFVVSHSSSMSEIFEKSITVIKEGGESRLEVAA